MKKFGKLLLILLLCFSFIGCNNSKSTSNITKKLKEAGYTIKYNKDEYTTVTISESKNGKDKNQFIAYVEKDKIESIAYIQLPEDSTNYDDMIIGYIYANKDGGANVDKNAKSAAEEILKKLSLTVDDLTNYALDIHKEKGKSLKD